MAKAQKHNSQVSPRWAFLKWFDIPDRDNPEVVYLRRLRIVQTPLFAVYLHWIYLPDNDRDPHDHPWNFWSFILRGGYIEELWFRRQTPEWKVMRCHWGRWSRHRMAITEAHRILELKPNTVTLLLVGKRQRTWGFHTPEGFVPYMEYDKGAGPDPFMS